MWTNIKNHHKDKNNKNNLLSYKRLFEDWQKTVDGISCCTQYKGFSCPWWRFVLHSVSFSSFSKRAWLSWLIISKATRTLWQKQCETLPEAARACHPLQPTQHCWLSITQLFMLKELSNKARSFWTAPTPPPLPKHTHTHTPLIDIKYLIEGKQRHHFDWFK